MAFFLFISTHRSEYVVSYFNSFPSNSYSMLWPFFNYFHPPHVLCCVNSFLFSSTPYRLYSIFSISFCLFLPTALSMSCPFFNYFHSTHIVCCGFRFIYFHLYYVRSLFYLFPSNSYSMLWLSFDLFPPTTPSMSSLAFI